MFDEELDEEDRWLLDEVTGIRRKPTISALNKQKLSKYEMDQLFANE